MALVLDPKVNPLFTVEAELFVGALNENEGVEENEEGAEEELAGNMNPELLIDDEEEVVVKLVAELVVVAAFTNPGRLLSHASH